MKYVSPPPKGWKGGEDLGGGPGGETVGFFT